MGNFAGIGRAICNFLSTEISNDGNILSCLSSNRKTVVTNGYYKLALGI